MIIIIKTRTIVILIMVVVELQQLVSETSFLLSDPWREQEVHWSFPVHYLSIPLMVLLWFQSDQSQSEGEEEELV